VSVVLCSGLELIAEGLAHNGSVLSLDLSDNRISSVGAIELAEALHSDKCKVAELLLANNRIGELQGDSSRIVP
jgi:Ran GTPase-activating protein (RanGAP) involved in mRNA processing and transport